MGNGHGSNRLPDTPWHIGFVKKEEDDPRRHKSRCIFKDGSTCKCGECISYMRKCPGSSHCRDYAENWLQAEENRIKNQSIAQETRERAVSYQTKMRIKVQKMMEEAPLQFSNLNMGMVDCPICKERFKAKGKNDAGRNKVCAYCGARFIPLGQKQEIPKDVTGFFVYDKRVTSNESDKMKKGLIYGCGLCKWCSGKGDNKCHNMKSPNYKKSGRRCDQFEMHERYTKKQK